MRKHRFFCVYKAVFVSQTWSVKQHDNLWKFQMERLWLPPYDWIKCLLFQLLHPKVDSVVITTIGWNVCCSSYCTCVLKAHSYRCQTERKQAKKFFFFPFQFIPWMTGYYQTVWQVKPFISDKKSQENLAKWQWLFGSLMGKVVRQWA